VLTEIIVGDNGTGIHPEDIHHIFKRFYRSRFSKDRQGVGIGLALSKAVVEKHGGTVAVQSEWGYGAEFHLIFPSLRICKLKFTQSKKGVLSSHHKARCEW
jgi:signal transduction histidine kinase